MTCFCAIVLEVLWRIAETTNPRKTYRKNIYKSWLVRFPRSGCPEVVSHLHINIITSSILVAIIIAFVVLFVIVSPSALMLRKCPVAPEYDRCPRTNRCTESRLRRCRLTVRYKGAPKCGWHDLSNATCLIWPRSFYVFFVVSRIVIVCGILRHV